MLDYKYILNNLDAVKQDIIDRNMTIDLAELQQSAQQRTKLLQEKERLNQQRKILAKQPPSTLQQSEGRKIKEHIAHTESTLRNIEAHYRRLLAQIPNRIHPESPRGMHESDCKTLSTWGVPPTFDFEPQDHLILGKNLNLFDFERAADISGTKFFYLKNEAVLLEIALIRYALNVLRTHGYDIYTTPDIVRQDIAAALGFNPRGNESNIYSIADSDLCLIGTSEITLGAYYRQQKIKATDLPIRMAGISHCFRREAGSAGRSGKGLFRVHQFTKAEMFVIAQPHQAEELHQELLSIEQSIFMGLEIPFRVRDICSGDLGAPAYRKFDIEAWMPGKEVNSSESSSTTHGSWGEVTSASNCTDYQARRLNTKTTDQENNTCFAYMLNGTAIATSRAIIALLENHQQRDGSIRIPKVLQPYTQFDTIGPQ